MRFGTCVELDKVSVAQSLGFDYVDINISKMMTYSDEEFLEKKAISEKSAIKVEAGCALLPPNLVLIGPNKVAEKTLFDYLDKAFSRLESLGVKIAGFGCGPTRKVSEGSSYGQMFLDLASVLKKMGDVAKNHNITILIEALNKNETNMINSLTEAVALESVVNHSNVKHLVDAYHFIIENEDLKHLQMCGPFCHAHIAEPNGRTYPTKDNSDLALFIEVLQKTGYNERLTIEANTSNIIEDSPKALENLRKWCN